MYRLLLIHIVFFFCFSGSFAQSLSYSVDKFSTFSNTKQQAILDSLANSYRSVYKMGQFEKSNSYAVKARELARSIGNKEIAAESMVYTSRYYGRVAKLDSSIFILRSMQKEFPQYFDKYGDMHYKTLGMFYNHQNKLDSALYFTLLADSMDMVFGDTANYAVKIQMSDIYQKMGRKDESVALGKGIMEAMESSADTTSRLYVLYRVANIAYSNDRLDVYGEAARQYLELGKNKKTRFHAGIFDLEVPIQKHISDLEYVRASYEDNNYLRGHTLASMKLMYLYVKAGKYKKAYDLLLLYEDEILTNNYENSSVAFLEAKLKVERALGLNIDALETSDLLVAYKDSVQQNSIIQSTLKLEEEYQTRQKEQEIKLLNTQNELQKSTLQRSNLFKWVLGLGTLILGLFSFYLIRNLRSKKRLNEELSAKNTIIAANLSEKETLLKEIHHRVKNNLQIVSSLLRLQARSITDEDTKEVLQEGQNRVQSMALIHQNLYKTDNLTGMEFKDYLEKLCDNLLNTYKLTSDEIELNLDIDPINLDVSTLIPLGLIINEIFTNSLKYAFEQNESKVLGVSLVEKGKELELTIQDNGIGATQDLIDYLNKPSVGRNSQWGFGTRLIKTFAQKLNADIQASNIDGTSILLKIRNYQVV